MASEENKLRQIEEIEALVAIFDNLVIVIDDSKFTVDLSTDGKTASLEVIFPADYPASAPPQYQLSAPFLRGTDRINICNELERIYLDNLGECIVYLWIEEIRSALITHENLEIRQKYDDEKATSPACVELFIAENPRFSSMPVPEIITSDIFEDRKSIFQGHTARVYSIEDVKTVLTQLKSNKKIAHATHNMYAYRIFVEERSAWLQDCDDDGETAAGTRMLHLLEILAVKNVLVVVSRWYGGIQLGADRFKHINNITRKVLEQAGYLPLEEDKLLKKKKK